jgi:hypothetical protein
MVIWPPAVVTSRRSLQPDLNERVQRKRRQLQKQKPETTATKDTTAAVKAGYAPRNAEVLWQVEKPDHDPTAGLNFLHWHLDAQEPQASKAQRAGRSARQRCQIEGLPVLPPFACLPSVSVKTRNPEPPVIWATCLGPQKFPRDFPMGYVAAMGSRNWRHVRTPRNVPIERKHTAHSNSRREERPPSAQMYDVLRTAAWCYKLNTVCMAETPAHDDI